MPPPPARHTVAYATTFVAQYLGANRPERVGPIIWQALYLSIFVGVAFLALLPCAAPVVALTGHAADLQELETTYLHCLCWAALPMLVTVAATSFFTGRGESWYVLVANMAGTAVNCGLAYLWIFGYGGFPELGIAGAGWATVAGSWAAALVALGCLCRREYRVPFNLLHGWRFDGALMRRLFYYGGPSGLHWSLDALAFSLFLLLIGQGGAAQLSATSIAFTLNLLAFLPPMGIAQAVAVLVGQRLGENRPDLAARSTWFGFSMAWVCMAVVGSTYVLVPDMYVSIFASHTDDPHWAEVAELTPMLLRFVALYCLFDSMNLVFSFALKGAGDTRFVSLLALCLSWGIMVLPTALGMHYDLGLAWAWTFATAYVIVLGLAMLGRFLQGRWRSMRVIEHAPLPGAGAVPADCRADAVATIMAP